MLVLVGSSGRIRTDGDKLPIAVPDDYAGAKVELPSDPLCDPPAAPSSGGVVLDDAHGSVEPL